MLHDNSTAVLVIQQCVLVMSMKASVQVPSDQEKVYDRDVIRTIFIPRHLESDSKQLERKETSVPSDHISCELNDGHPASGGGMNGANDFHMLLRDPSIRSDLPTRICCHVAVRHALLIGSVI